MQLHSRFTLRQLLVIIAALAVVLVPASRWIRARMEFAAAIRADLAVMERARVTVLPAAARKYQALFGKPAPSYRSLPAGEVAHISVKWDRSRQAYVVGFGQQIVVNSVRDFAGRPIPYSSGSTSFEFFAVKPDGRCEYAGSTSGGEY